MQLTTPENCALLCSLLADLFNQRSVIETRRAVIEQVGVDGPDQEALDTEQMRHLAAAIALLQQLLESLGCDCGNCMTAVDGGPSSGLSPL